MERAGYMQGVQRLLQERALACRFPENAALSLPMTVRTASGAIADAVFLYEDTPGRGRPFAWALLELATGEPLVYARCEANDFFPDRAVPPGAALALTPPQLLSEATRADARRELGGLYEQLRGFILGDGPTAEQKALITRYARLFEMLAYREHRPFYRALGGPFLDRLGLSPAEWPGPSGGAAAEPAVAEALRELSELFVRKIETDQHKQRLFDEMHAELQQYKNNLIDTLTRPMEGDVIKLIDDIEKSMEVYRSRPFSPDNYRRLFTLFEGVGTDLADLLYRHGLEPYSQEGDEVTVGRQKILATVPTEKKSLDKKVAVRHSRGWEKNGKIIRPERISVYLYTPPGERKKEGN